MTGAQPGARAEDGYRHRREQSRLPEQKGQITQSYTEILHSGTQRRAVVERWVALPALALLSGSGLLLEVALTRLFSTLYYPPTVFAVISLAVLGLGLGAALVTARPGWREARYTSLYGAAAGLSTLLVAAVAVWTAGLDLLPLLLLLVAAPFVFIGMVVAVIFADYGEASTRLYLADLVGAGLGAWLAVPLLDVLGGVNGVLGAAMGLGLGAVILAIGGLEIGGWRLGIPVAVLVIGMLVLGANLGAGFLGVDMGQLEKPIEESLDGGGTIVATRWDAFARSDLVAPGDGGAYELYIDGAAGSVMPPATDNEFLYRDIGFFPFATEQPERVFVIGPGGGLDVWFGLESRAEEIVAVEVNGASVELVREFAAYNGDLYGQPGVRVVGDEGRSVLRREGQQYELIFMSQVVTLAAERQGYALVEETAYTVEAFRDYFEHLSPNGMLALKLYDEPTLTRALGTALAALRGDGAMSDAGPLSDADALTHVMAFVDPRSDPPIPLLMVRNSAFSREDSLSLGAVAQQVGFVPLFLPHVLAEPPLEAVAEGEIPFSEIVENADSDISPTSDNRPFFYQFERGLPASLRPLLIGMLAVVVIGGGFVAAGQRAAEYRGQAGYRGLEGAFARYAPVYFAALGVGFIMLEIAIIQQTRLFLGHPTLAITTVLATLLVGGGLGSGLAGRIVAPAARPPSWPALAVVGLALGWVLLWPLLADGFVGAVRGVRVLVVVAALLPLALAMGMPFPLGLRALGPAGERQVALAWAVNGLMTVVGSVLAVSLAMAAGFSSVTMVAVVAYVVAALVSIVSRQISRR